MTTPEPISPRFFMFFGITLIALILAKIALAGIGIGEEMHDLVCLTHGSLWQ